MQAEPKKTPAGSLVGQEYEVEIGPVAHGGHCIARTDAGQVLFVRHALPGERVVARVTEGEEDSRFLRADAVTVLEASKDRVEAPVSVRRSRPLRWLRLAARQAGRSAAAQGRGRRRAAPAPRGPHARGGRLGRHGDAGRGGQAARR